MLYNVSTYLLVSVENIKGEFIPYFCTMNSAIIFLLVLHNVSCFLRLSINFCYVLRFVQSVLQI